MSIILEQRKSTTSRASVAVLQYKKEMVIIQKEPKIQNTYKSCVKNVSIVQHRVSLRTPLLPCQ